MVSELNQPDFTEYSPRTIPAITLNGVVSMLGVLTAAVNGKFQDQKLEDQGNVHVICQFDKFQPAWDPVLILHKEKPYRGQKQGEK